MLMIKGCPRCAGDVVRVQDYDGPVLSCVQCGFVRYADAPQAVAARTPDEATSSGVLAPAPDLEPVAVASISARTARTPLTRSARPARTSSRARRAA